MPEQDSSGSAGSNWPPMDDPDVTRVVRRSDGGQIDPGGSDPERSGGRGDIPDPDDAQEPSDAPHAAADDSGDRDPAADPPGSQATAAPPDAGRSAPEAPAAPAAPASGDSAPAWPSGAPADPVTGGQPTTGGQPGQTPSAPGPMAGEWSSTDPGHRSPPGYRTGPQDSPGPGYGPAHADAEPTGVMGSGSAATSYLGAPTATYPGPGAPTGPQGYAQSGYGYQQGGYPDSAMPPGAGPQVVPPPATANVMLPPVRLPKAESRVALNILGAIVGLILVVGGLVLMLLFQGKMRTLDTSDLDAAASGDVSAVLGGGLDAVSVVLTIVGVVLIAVAALIAAWASWAAILPGFLLSAVSVWAMITTGPSSGGVLINKGTSWAFDNGQFAAFCMNGMGLLVGLLLFAAGLAAVFLRAGVRRTIRQQLESIQS